MNSLCDGNSIQEQTHTAKSRLVSSGRLLRGFQKPQLFLICALYMIGSSKAAGQLSESLHEKRPPEQATHIEISQQHQQLLIQTSINQSSSEAKAGLRSKSTGHKGNYLISAFKGRR